MMICMPLLRVTACTWSAPRTCSAAITGAHTQVVIAASNDLLSNPRDMPSPLVLQRGES
jgi:hypothetical protein